MKPLTLQEEQLLRQAKARSLTERAPWLFSLNDAIIVNKDSSLLACFEFDGPDVTSATHADMNALALRAQKALRMLTGRPINMWWTVRRRRTRAYRSVAMPNSIAQLIDDQLRADFAEGKVFSNHHYLSVSLLPVSGSSQFFERLHYFHTHEQMPPMKAMLYAIRAMFKARDTFAYTAASLDDVAHRFDQLIKDFQASLPECRFRRLSGDALRAFLLTAFPRADSNITGVGPPLDGQMLDGYLIDQNVYVGHNFAIFENERQHYAAAATIKPRGYPSGPEGIGGTEVGMLHGLLAINGEITISQCFRFASREEQEAHIKEMRRFNEVTKFSAKQWLAMAFNRQGVSPETMTSRDAAKESFSQEADAAQADITAGDIHYGWHNLTVLAHGDTKEHCDCVYDEVSLALRDKSMVPMRETLHLDSSIGGTIPGQWADVVHWHFLSTANVADLVLLNTHHKGEPLNAYLSEQLRVPCYCLAMLQTREKTVYCFNTHYGDLAHMFVVGFSRTGKTVFCNFIWVRFLQYPNANVVILDRDNSCRIPTLLLGGQHVTIESDPEQRHRNGITFGPVAALLGHREHWEWLADWIRLLIEMNGYEMDSSDVKAVWTAIDETAHLKDRALWRLNTVRTHLPKSLQDHLEQWVEDGPYAHYFDNATDAFSLGKVTCIEMSDILANKRVAAPFLLYIFMRVDTNLAFRPNGMPAPTMIYAEECSFLLRDPSVSQQLRKWAATLAKRLTTLMMTTQSFEDLKGSEIFPAIRDNFPSRILMPTKKATRGSALHKLLRTEFNLNEKEIDLLGDAVPKRDYVFVNPDGATLVELALKPESAACLRSDKLAQSVFDKHWNGGQGRAGWQQSYIQDLIATEEQYLEQKGFDDETEI